MADEVPVRDLLCEAMEYLTKLGSNLQTRSENLKEKKVNKNRLKNAHAIQKAASKVLLICELSKKSLENVENGVRKVLSLVDSAQASLSDTKSSTKDDEISCTSSNKNKPAYHYFEYDSRKLKITRKISLDHYTSLKVLARRMSKSKQNKYPVYYDCKLYQMRQKIENDVPIVSNHTLIDKNKSTSEESDRMISVQESYKTEKSVQQDTNNIENKLTLRADSSERESDGEKNETMISVQESCKTEKTLHQDTNNIENKLTLRGDSSERESDGEKNDRMISVQESYKTEKTLQQHTNNIENKLTLRADSLERESDVEKKSSTNSQSGEMEKNTSLFETENKLENEVQCSELDNEKNILMQNMKDDVLPKKSELEPTLLSAKLHQDCLDNSEDNISIENQEKSNKNEVTLAATLSESDTDNEKEIKDITIPANPKKLDKGVCGISSSSKRKLKLKKRDGEKKKYRRVRFSYDSSENSSDTPLKMFKENENNEINLVSDEENINEKVERNEKDIVDNKEDSEVSEVKKPLIKCVNITKLLKPDVLQKSEIEPLQNNRKNRNNSNENRNYSRTNKLENKKREEKEYWDQKRKEVKAFKPKKFTIDVTVLPKLSEEFLNKYSLKRIVQNGCIVFEIKHSSEMENQSDVAAIKSTLNELSVDDATNVNESNSVNLEDVQKVKNALLNESDSEKSHTNSYENNSKSTEKIKKTLLKDSDTTDNNATDQEIIVEKNDQPTEKDKDENHDSNKNLMDSENTNVNEDILKSSSEKTNDMSQSESVNREMGKSKKRKKKFSHSPDSKRKHIMESMHAKRMLLTYSSSSDTEDEKLKETLKEIKESLLRGITSDEDDDIPILERKNREKLSVKEVKNISKDNDGSSSEENHPINDENKCNSNKEMDENVNSQSDSSSNKVRL